MNFNILEDQWDENFSWFLVDKGKIQYAFKDRVSALTYKKEGYLDYMLLTNLNNITHDTMIDPKEYSSWEQKIQTCVDIEW